MKLVLLTVSGLVLCTLGSYAQTKVTSLPDSVNKNIQENVAAKKTNASQSLLSDFYQFALNDVTGTGKQISFSGTLTAWAAAFRPSKADQSPSFFENNFQPVINFGYKNNFQNINASAGFKFAFINQTDVKNSPLLNNNQDLLNEYNKLGALDEPVRRYLVDRANAQYNDPVLLKQIDSLQLVLKKRQANQDAAGVKEVNTQIGNVRQLVNAKNQLSQSQLGSLLDKLTQLENGSDTTKIDPDLGKAFEAMAGDPTAAQASIKSITAQASLISAKIESVSQKIAKGWNVTFNPLLIYQITYGGIQGLDLGAKASKGFNVFKDKSRVSQLLFALNYNIGADTLVSKINTKRRQLTDQFGFNQVLFSSLIQSVSKTDKTPWMELGLTGSYNYVFDGLKPKEKSRQPALNLKYGILIGKSSWLTVPFTYNFAQKTGMALVSINVNVGDSPFSK